MLSLVDRLSNDGQAGSVTRTQLDEDRLNGIQIRAATAGDCAAITSFVAGLSLRARLLRFFTPVSPPSSTVLRRMCGATPGTDVLVATDGDAVVGHAMAVDTTGPDGRPAADLGLVVADGWQNRGLGSEMFRRLTERAAGRGLGAAVMDVLPENRQMLSMISRRWADAGYEFSGGSLTIRVPLPAPPAPPAADAVPAVPTAGRAGQRVA
jgi:ribosomal protein S18 acetylase RimI-like enzyme